MYWNKVWVLVSLALFELRITLRVKWYGPARSLGVPLAVAAAALNISGTGEIATCG